jgi:ADP-ribosylation factor-like protein 8
MSCNFRWVASFFRSVRDWFLRHFRKQQMDLTLVGLQGGGKSTLAQYLTTGEFTAESIPTVGFTMRKVTKGRLTIKMWDVGGQTRFRPLWDRCCRGVDAILFVVDAADRQKFSCARRELEELMMKPQLQDTPLLVIANKMDLPDAAAAEEMIVELGLDKCSASQRPAFCAISVKEEENIKFVLDWLLEQTKPK